MVSHPGRVEGGLENRGEDSGNGLPELTFDNEDVTDREIVIKESAEETGLTPERDPGAVDDIVAVVQEGAGLRREEGVRFFRPDPAIALSPEEEEPLIQIAGGNEAAYKLTLSIRTSANRILEGLAEASVDDLYYYSASAIPENLRGAFESARRAGSLTGMQAVFRVLATRAFLESEVLSAARRKHEKQSSPAEISEAAKLAQKLRNMVPLRWLSKPAS